VYLKLRGVNQYLTVYNLAISNIVKLYKVMDAFLQFYNMIYIRCVKYNTRF